MSLKCLVWRKYRTLTLLIVSVIAEFFSVCLKCVIPIGLHRMDGTGAQGGTPGLFGYQNTWWCCLRVRSVC